MLKSLCHDRLLYIALVALTTISCQQSDVQSLRSDSTATPKSITQTTTAGEAVSNSVALDSGQTISHFDGNSRIAQVHIPTGALAIDQEVTMSSSFHTDPSDLRAEFGIDSGTTITETKVATVITSNVDKNLSQPMIVALDLPTATGLLGLVYDDRNFMVVYTVRDADNDVWRRGIMPDEALEVKDDKVQFASQMMGRYEVFETSEPVKGVASEQQVTNPDFTNPPVAIEKVSTLIARPGNTVILTGKYFSAKSKISVNDIEVDTAGFVSPQRMTFTVPDTTDFGPGTITVVEGTNTASIGFVVHNKDASKAYVDATPDNVCRRIDYYDAAGTLQVGTKDCYRDECKAGDQTDCYATAAFPAIEPGAIPAAQIFTNLTILGKQGTMPIPTYTQACTSNGQAGCQAKNGFMALDTSLLNPGVVKSGHPITFNGNTITGDYPSENYKFDTYSASEQQLEPTMIASDLASTGKTLQYWDRTGARYTLQTNGSLKADAIKQGITIFGVTGEIPNNARTCNKSGDQDCQATGVYQAVQRAKFTEGNFKNGTPMGTITGQYPSSTFPLKTINNGVTELKGSNFNTAIASTNQFTYFKNSGAQVTRSGTNLLMAENIKSGVELFGVTGTLTGFPDGTFKADDIRKGVTVGGVAGNLPIACRNMASLYTYNLTTAPGSADTSTADPFDNHVDETIPSDNPWGLDGNNYACTHTNWENIDSVACGTDIGNCAFKDKITGKTWGVYHPTGMNFNDANSHCEGITNYLGSSDWRLPTYEELRLAMAHGMYYLKQYKGTLFAPPQTGYSPVLWTSTQVDTGSNEIHYMTMDARYGTSVKTTRLSSGLTFCVKSTP